MTTNNPVNTTLLGQSGAGAFAGTNSPVFITPSLGAATATSIAFNPTTSGIIGTTTNDNAAAGIVGEFVESIILSGSPVALTSTVSANVTSISLTPGDWWVEGNVTFLTSTSLVAACWSSITSATLPDPALYNDLTGTASSTFGFNIPGKRYSLASTETIYLSCQTVFSGACDACGGIYARRMR